MKPLIVLAGAFILSFLSMKIFQDNDALAFSGRAAMSAMLVFTSIGHFAFTKGMKMMMPSFIPFRTQIVYLIGMIELIFAIGLLIPGIRITIAWLLIAFFILILPANIYSAIKHVDYQKGNFSGSGKNYLWFRVPLQILFIVWTYLSAIY